MSKVKVIDGVEYILKTDVDEIVSSRISKYAEKVREYESRIDSYQSEIDAAKSSAGLVEKLNGQIDTLQSELSTARSQYERHSTIGQYGITDPNIRDAIEWSFEREMKGRPKKDQTSLGDWLTTIKDNPETAPAVLRPFFNPSVSETKTEQPPAAVEQQNPAALQQQPSPLQNQVVQNQPTTAVPPTSNAGVKTIGSVPPSDLLSRASDPEFYTKNRDAIRQAFYSQKGKPSSFKF